MARQHIFHRNIRAGEQLELFLVSGVASLLLLRFYLYITGYPQVGGGSLHIAHMLYGGIFMLISIVLLLSFLGRRLQRFCAILGGVGFGIFIDEIGKFLTKDNNYFFKPAIGIIYAIFVILYLSFNFLGRRQRLSSREYQLNALNGLEEAVLLDMDNHEKAKVLQLLKRADQSSQITQQLTTLLKSINPVPTEQPSRLNRLKAATDRLYTRAWKGRGSNILVQAFFLLEAGLFLLAVVLTISNNVDSVLDFFRGHPDYGHSLVIGQAISTVVASGFAIVGAYKLIRTNRSDAFEWFRRATLVNIFLTEFFIFSRIQFGAMPGFIVNIVVLLLINFVLNQERRNSSQTR